VGKLSVFGKNPVIKGVKTFVSFEKGLAEVTKVEGI